MFVGMKTVTVSYLTLCFTHTCLWALNTQGDSVDTISLLYLSLVTVNSNVG
jgi:hypothetical protein